MTSIAPTRILIVGGGGREHALAWKLASEPGGNEIVVAPGSDAIAREPRVRCLPGVDPLDPAAVVTVARREAVELVVIGPEAPLAAGVSDALRDAGIAVFGPSAAAARIESSKAFCHEIAAAAGVPMARGASFGDAAGARRFAAELAADGQGVVVKADGLAAGKGVTRLRRAGRGGGRHRPAVRVGSGDDRRDRGAAVRSRGEPDRDLRRSRRGRPAAVTRSQASRRRRHRTEHRRDGCLQPVAGPAGRRRSGRLLATFHRPILAELARRGTPFRGALYAGLILTSGGPVLLECNARFGDPETQAILPRLAIALGPVLLAAARGDLPSALPSGMVADGRLPDLPGAAVAIVLAAAGYPGRPSVGRRIDGLDEAAATGALIFHAGHVDRSGRDGADRRRSRPVGRRPGRGPVGRARGRHGRRGSDPGRRACNAATTSARQAVAAGAGR